MCFPSSDKKYKPVMFTMSGLRTCMVLLITVTAAHTGNFKSGSVYCKERKCSFDPKKYGPMGALAYGTYNDSLLTTGWGILNIVSGNGTNDDIMYAAGVLEGFFTAEQIYQNYQNLYFTFFANDEQYAVKAKTFFREQDAWMREMITKNPSDPFWRHVGYIVAQFDGLMDGYKMANLTALDKSAFQILNAFGDLLDLKYAVMPDSVPDWQKMSKDELFRFMYEHTHCSALVKVLGAYENVFMSHSSWFPYAASMRIYKHYNFNVDDEYTAARRSSFSSYPGCLESVDDFYILGSQMVMLETTNNVFNMTLFKSVKPSSLLAWQRVRVANMMAHSGREWAKALASYNSGTYNNQYMVIDLKKIQLKQTILDDALWVVEQIPTLVVSGDQTDILRAGYWSSYNIPFYEKIYDMSGYPAVVAKMGPDASYQLAPRAKIFRRDQDKVVDMVTMKKLMRYNDYKTDPYSEDDACKSICCRGDLTNHPKAFGCYDTKVSDFHMALNFTTDIINGPTLGTNLPPFKWTPEFNVSHVGLPPVYDFDFIRTQPDTL